MTFKKKTETQRHINKATNGKTFDTAIVRVVRFSHRYRRGDKRVNLGGCTSYGLRSADNVFNSEYKYIIQGSTTGFTFIYMFILKKKLDSFFVSVPYIEARVATSIYELNMNISAAFAKCLSS